MSEQRQLPCANAVCVFQEWIDCGCLTGNSSDFAAVRAAVQLTLKAQWLLYIPPVLNINKYILCPVHAVYFCVLCGSENKQRLFPYKT